MQDDGKPACARNPDTGKCANHDDGFDAGHMSWDNEPVCDWWAWMFEHNSVDDGCC